MRVLDSLIEPQLAGNIVLLVQWKAAKRFTGRAVPIASTTIDAAARGPAEQSADTSAPATVSAPSTTGS